MTVVPPKKGYVVGTHKSTPQRHLKYLPVTNFCDEMRKIFILIPLLSGAITNTWQNKTQINEIHLHSNR